MRREVCRGTFKGGAETSRRIMVTALHWDANARRLENYVFEKNGEVASLRCDAPICSRCAASECDCAGAECCGDAGDGGAAAGEFCGGGEGLAGGGGGKFAGCGGLRESGICAGAPE